MWCCTRDHSFTVLPMVSSTEYTLPLHMAFKRIKRIVSYAKTGYGAYKTLRRLWKNRRRRRMTYRRTKSVSFKAMSSKKYGAKMNKLFRVGRV